MEKSNSKITNILSLLLGNYRLIVPAVVVIIIIGAIVVWLNRDNTIDVGTSNTGIEITDTKIGSIQNIGEWEFLSVNDEEMIDTIRHGFFGDDHLARIYYGTVRLGINLKHSDSQWLTTNKDTIIAKLPKIAILDDDFIDETRTRSFFAEGKWTAADYKTMYQKAYRTMKERCLTESNIRSAQANGEEQVANLLHSMGYKNIRIEWEK